MCVYACVCMYVSVVDVDEHRVDATLARHAVRVCMSLCVYVCVGGTRRSMSNLEKHLVYDVKLHRRI